MVEYEPDKLDAVFRALADRTPPGFWATHTRLEGEYDKLIP